MPSGKAGIHQLVVMLISLKVPGGKPLFGIQRNVSRDDGFVLRITRVETLQ